MQSLERKLDHRSMRNYLQRASELAEKYSHYDIQGHCLSLIDVVKGIENEENDSQV